MCLASRETLRDQGAFEEEEGEEPPSTDSDKFLLD